VYEDYAFLDGLRDDLVINTIGPTPGRILDIGSGTGRLAHRLRNVARSLHGVDVSIGMMSLAKRRLAACSSAHLYFMDANSLAFKGEVFDCVTCCYALHHLDFRSAIEEAVRVLRPGGVLIIEAVIEPDGLRNSLRAIRKEFLGLLKASIHVGLRRIAIGLKAARNPEWLSHIRWDKERTLYPTYSEFQMACSEALPGAEVGIFGWPKAYVIWRKSGPPARPASRRRRLA